MPDTHTDLLQLAIWGDLGHIQRSHHGGQGPLCRNQGRWAEKGGGQRFLVQKRAEGPGVGVGVLDVHETRE